MKTQTNPAMPLPSALIAAGDLGRAQTALGTVVNTDENGNQSGMNDAQLALFKAIGEEAKTNQALAEQAQALGL